MRFTRRSVLRGLLGGSLVTLGLPPLEMFMNTHGTAWADGSGFPKRFGLFFWGNGVLPERWVPAKDGSGDEWELSEQLSPLAAFKSRMTVVSGTRIELVNEEPHHSTAAGILTGHELIFSGNSWTYGAPTIDQIIANGIESSTYKSLEFGAYPGDGMSWNGPNSLNPAEKNPLAFFNRLFGGDFQLPGEGGEPNPSLAVKRSVLDAVMGQIKTLESQVGSADKARLEQHWEGLFDIEQRLKKLQLDPPNLEACAIPGTPEADYPDIEGRAQLQELNRAFCDVLTLALACDQSRVFSNTFTRPLANVLFQEVNAGHHQLTHDEPGEQPQVNHIVLQCMEAFRYQLESLASIQEGDATLLDHCIVMGTTDCAEGKFHSPENYPIVLVSGTGDFKTDLHYRSPGDNTSKVPLSVIRAMGVDLAEFGEGDGRVTDGLGAIEA